MSQFEGGYSSAVNSENERTARDFTNQHLAQIIQQRAVEMALQNALQQRQAAGRAGAASTLFGPNAAPVGAPFAGPSNAAGTPQSPSPGEASVPMQAPTGAPPMDAPGGMSQMPPGAPDVMGAGPENSPSPGPSEPPAAPPPGWQASPSASPELGGREPSLGGVAAPESVGAPPSIQVPRGMTTTALINGLQKDQKMTPQDKLAALEYLHPILKQQEAETVAEFKRENEGLKRANEAYKAYMYGQSVKDKAVNTRSLVDTRAARVAQGEQRNDLARQTLEAKLSGVLTKGAAAGGMDLAGDDATRRFMAEQYWAGDRSVMQNLGRGAQGAQNIIALRKEIAQVGRETQRTPQDLATAMAEFEGLKAGERTAGNRAANIEIAANEAKELSGLAVEASNAFDRTGWKSVNDIQKAVQSRTASPELRNFDMANNALINAYARAISPQGVSTVSDKDHAREILSTAFSKGDYESGVAQLQKELNAALKSPGMAKASMRERAGGRQETPGMPSAPGGTVSPDGTRVNVTADQTPAGKAAMQRDITLKGQVEAAGQKYEPEKFDYKVEGGKVFRKPK